MGCQNRAFLRGFWLKGWLCGCVGVRELGAVVRRPGGPTVTRHAGSCHPVQTGSSSPRGPTVGTQASVRVFKPGRGHRAGLPVCLECPSDRKVWRMLLPSCARGLRVGGSSSPRLGQVLWASLLAFLYVLYVHHFDCPPRDAGRGWVARLRSARRSRGPGAGSQSSWFSRAVPVRRMF